jgi:EmrB/QacA subfamily drug resistance transporter
MTEKTYKNKWLVLFSAGLMILLINIDGTIVNVALAKISVALNADLTIMQWVMASYLLATAIFFTICGRLADMHGNKRMFLIGTAVFTIASLLCGLSPNAYCLISARFIQGFGFASTLGIAILLVTNAFPPEQRGLASGMAVTLTGLGQIIGPTVGGVILHFSSWHWIFLVNVPIGIICLILSSLFAPKDEITCEKHKLDPTSVTLFALGLAIITATLNETAHLQTGNILLFVAIGIACLIGYGLRSMHSQHPMIATSLLTHPEYLKVSLTRLLFMLIWAVVLLFIPLYLQNIIGYSPLKTGLLILVMTAMIAIGSPITGKLVDIFGFKPLLVLSMLLAAISCILMSFFHSPSNTTLLIVSFILFGTSVGIHIPSSLNGVIRTSETQHRSTAMGLFFTIALVGSIIGIAVSGSYMSEKSSILILHELVRQGMHIHHATLTKLQSVASGAHNVSWMRSAVPTHQLASLAKMAHRSFIHTFEQLMWINAVLCLIGMCIASRIKMDNLVD